MLYNVATISPAKITVNYTAETSSKVASLIENKTDGSRIVKGVQI